MRARLFLVTAGALVATSMAGAGPARASEPIDAVYLETTTTTVRRLLEHGNISVGLLVFPTSQDPRRLFPEIAALRPGRTPIPARGGGPTLFGLLHRAGVVSFAGIDPPTRGLAAAYRDADRLGSLRILRPRSYFEAARMVHNQDVAFIVGMDRFTPALLGVTTGSGGLLAGGIARRDGVVTPYDVAATILDEFGLPNDTAGNVLYSADVRSSEAVDAMRARFERDAHFGRGLAVATVVFGLAPLLLALALSRTTRRDLSKRLLRASVAAPAGYVIALFIPHGNWAVRTIGIALACIAAALLPARDTRRFVGWVFALTAAAVALLSIAAELNPNGEPALSLWGNPLTSWRFFGLRNHLAAFIAGGAIVGLLLLEVPLVVGVLSGAAALVVTGAPRLGANFIGVLTLAFGISLGLLVLWRKRFEIWQFFAAGVLGLGATFLAFLSDVGSPVSHGGRAAQTVRSGGLRAGWDIFAERARLNYREVMDIPIPLAGPVAFVGVTLVLGALLVWAYRARALEPFVRAAVAGGAAAAFAALFVEDSGFFTGGILALYPATAFLLVLLDGDAGTTRSRRRAGRAPPLLPQA